MPRSVIPSADPKSTHAIHHSLPAVLVTAAVSFALGPFAFRQFGVSGLVVVACFGSSMILSVFLAAWGAAKLVRKHELVARLFASSGVRMVAPLVIALVVVAAGGRIAPVESVYYVLPLYLCMLIVDVLSWVREAKSSTLSGPHGKQCGPIAHGEAG